MRLERIPAFETALAHLADIVRRDLGADLAEKPGAGAAGGLGYGLMTFARARMEAGFDLVARVTGLESAVRAADIVITGEGSVDHQTLNGKGPAGVAGMARRMGKPAVVVGGLVDESAAEGLNAVFHAVIAAARRDNMEEALKEPAQFVEAAVASAGAQLTELLGA